MRLCRSGKIPFVKRFSLSLQAKQLSLALTEVELILAVALRERDPSSDALIGFARASEWLARETGARVLAVLPDDLASRRELDAISFESADWAFPEGIGPDSDGRPTESKHQIHPIVGRPHPGSPGEQLLASRLPLEPDIGSLFGFNQPVVGIFGNRFLVDLLWQAGRVIVEVDGFGFHRSRESFNGDRERDYELTVTGYLVLRLPHDLVMEDPERAILRIRDFVVYRRKRPFRSEETPA